MIGKCTLRVSIFDIFIVVRHIMLISIILFFFYYSLAYCRYLDQCLVVFPFTDSLGPPIMVTGKNHSIKHTPSDVVRYCDAINVSCEAPETAYKNWVKEQGDCINQGPHVQMTMMLHSLRKEASAMLCEGVQGKCTS